MSSDSNDNMWELSGSPPSVRCGSSMVVQVPEDRLGRLEQEHRTLALELRLTVSVAEEVGMMG